MQRNCKCGGKLRRSDIEAVYDRQAFRMMYQDKDPLMAHWKCEKCGAIREQRKRQSVKKKA